MERAQSGERPEREHHAHRHDRSERDRPSHQHRHGVRPGRGVRSQSRQQRRHRRRHAVGPIDLSVTITNAATTLVPGSLDTYTITVANNGSNTVSSFDLIDTIPDALLNATFGSPSAGSYDRVSGHWSGLSLANGQSVSITLSGVVGIATGTLSNTVTVAAPAGMTDTNLGNNAATDADTLVLFGSPYPPAPAATSANMLLRRGDGLYAIYNLGNNATLATHPLAQVGTEWRFAGLGSFQVGDTADMLLRNASTGGFQVYDVSNNNVTNTAFLGNVGIDWQLMGFGNFSSRGETDMILRNSNTGGLQVYDISNNQITGTASMGTVGLNWQFSGVGNFSGAASPTCCCATPIPGDCSSTTSPTTNLSARHSLAPWASIGSSRASAISAALPAKPISSCATSIPAGWRCMTSTTINSPAPPSSAPLASSGSLPALPRSAARARPTSSCATSTPAYSRPTTSPTIKSSAPPAWDGWDWSGRSAGSRPILPRING